MKNIKIFTDGACSGNPGAGGWGVVIVSGNDIQKLNGFEPDTTNNRMELKAAIEGIKQSSRGSNITLYTDSKYVKNGITDWIKNWKKITG
jgi:ribonuclease HI